MRSNLLKLAVFVSSLVLAVAGGGGTDTCGEIHDILKVLDTHTKKSTSVGKIDACLCLSTLSSYISSNSLTKTAVSIAGQGSVTDALTAMINSGNHGTCKYPQHSEPRCQFGNPCAFTCTDGYLPSPLIHPTNCVCLKPFTVCNGFCGLYKGCPSAHPKRALPGPSAHPKRALPGPSAHPKRELYGSYRTKCPKGLTECKIPDRGVDSTECVDTQRDLESCGGCMIQSFPGHFTQQGVDCTAIHGVADVACIKGKCVVHKCMPGYFPDKKGGCTKVEGKYD